MPAKEKQSSEAAVREFRRRARSKTGKRYAYYHCHRCRTTSLRRKVLEERFLELVDRLKPTKKNLEALKETVLLVWRRRKEELDEMRPLLEQRIAKLEARKRRLVHAYVCDQAIDQETYRKELTAISGDLALVKVEHHGNEIDTFDVEAVLEFAEYVVLNARRLWKEFPLELRRRMQKALFPEGLVWSGEAFRTPVTCLFFRDLERPEIELEKVVARSVPTWNQISQWLRDLTVLQQGRFAAAPAYGRPSGTAVTPVESSSPSCSESEPGSRAASVAERAEAGCLMRPVACETSSTLLPLKSPDATKECQDYRAKHQAHDSPQD